LRIDLKRHKQDISRCSAIPAGEYRNLGSGFKHFSRPVIFARQTVKTGWRNAYLPCVIITANNLWLFDRYE
jgi:hypothetical protein